LLGSHASRQHEKAFVFYFKKKKAEKDKVCGQTLSAL